MSKYEEVVLWVIAVVALVVAVNTGAALYAIWQL